MIQDLRVCEANKKDMCEKIKGLKKKEIVHYYFNNSELFNQSYVFCRVIFILEYVH